MPSLRACARTRPSARPDSSAAWRSSTPPSPPSGSAHAGATSELEAARAALAAAEVANRGEAVARAALDDELDRERVARATLTAALDAARAETAAAQARVAELERDRAAAEHEAGGLLARIAELERPADGDLDRRAGEQAAAAAAAVRPPDEARREVAVNLDAAAAALRARTPAPEDAPPAAAPRPRIVTESPHPARADIVGSSKREYPWLRGALVKLAHDDPRTATRLMLALVPAQRAIVAAPLEYDLTIRGSGTYAVSIEEGEATARTVGEPRPRDQAAFHLSADVVTLAEMLAGVDKRMGRWLGPVKVHGRRRGALALRDALAGADLDLAAAARAGADLDPELVFRAFAYAIRPAWTKGHRSRSPRRSPARSRSAGTSRCATARRSRSSGAPRSRRTPSWRCPAPRSATCSGPSRRRAATGRRSAATAPPWRR